MSDFELTDGYKRWLRAGGGKRIMLQEHQLASEIWNEFKDLPEEERLQCAVIVALDSFSARTTNPDQRTAKALERIADRLDSWDARDGQTRLDVYSSNRQ